MVKKIIVLQIFFLSSIQINSSMPPRRIIIADVEDLSQVTQALQRYRDNNPNREKNKKSENQTSKVSPADNNKEIKNKA